MLLALKYSLFALVATLANIGCQDLSSRVYGGRYELMVAMMVGTGVGLLVKYVLDKKYIFAYKSKDLLEDSRLFALYTLMGVFTTLIFWGVEIGFDTVFGTRPARYAGAVIGLAIGYWTKYQLDKRFVFGKSA